MRYMTNNHAYFLNVRRALWATRREEKGLTLVGLPLDMIIGAYSRKW